jgi:cytoskeleton protein RodZ
MNDASRAVAEDGGSYMDSGDHLEGTAASGAGYSAGLPDDHASPSAQSLEAVNATVSAKLRAAREALGLTTGDIAKRTRVTLRHIEALEAGDYAAMPGRPYAIGFARGYALVVGLDGTAIADAVRAELQGRTPRAEARVLHQFEVGDPAKTPTRLLVWLAALLAAGILAMGAVFWRSYYAPAAALPPLADSPEPAAASLTRAQANVAVPPSDQPASGGTAVFTALEEGIWVKFYDGQGKQLMQKQLAKGESYTVPADAVSPMLWTGRPDALAIAIGGQAIPRLAEAEGIMKDVPVDAASLRARARAPASDSAATVGQNAVPHAGPNAVAPPVGR